MGGVEWSAASEEWNGGNHGQSSLLALDALAEGGGQRKRKREGGREEKKTERRKLGGKESKREGKERSGM